MREIVFSRLALKDRQGIPRTRVAEIGRRLRALAAGERENLDVKPLAGHQGWQRLRVGDYRIVFRERNGRIEVARVVSRQELEQAVRRLG